MKVAVSIPDPVFADADALAKRLNTTRSDLYARALHEFVDNHAPDRITQAMNDTLDGIAQKPDVFRTQAARQAFSQTEW